MISTSGDRRNFQRRKRSESSGGHRSIDRRNWIGKESDRRALVRLPESLPVLLSSEDEIFKEFRESAVNISARGLQIHSKKEFAIGSQLHLCIYPPDLFVPIQVDSRVEWRRYNAVSKSYTYGLSFRDPTGEYQGLLDQFILGRIHENLSKKARFRKRLGKFFYKSMVKTVLNRSLIGQRAVAGRSDSGFTFDHIYSNEAKGTGLLGRWVDKVLLDLPAAKASRYRKDLIKEALQHEIQMNMTNGQMTRILDLGSGTSRYLLESVGIAEAGQVEALCIDRDKESIRHARRVSKNLPFRFVQLDIFKTQRLEALSGRSGWRPNLIIVSGLIYYFSDKRVKTLIKQIYEWIEPGGMLLITNMIQNPNKKLIGHLFVTQGGDPWIPLARPVHLVRNWLADSGFQNVHHAKDPWEMYSVFSARKDRGKIKSANFEFRTEGSILKGKIYQPTQSNKKEAVVLFIHGLGYTFSTYRLTPSVFCNQKVGLAVYNMSNHANSTGEWSLDTSVAAVSRAVDSLVERIGQNASIFLFAHSTGALIAFLAAQRDRRIRGMSLVNIVTSVTDSYLHWHKTGYNQEVKEFFKIDGTVPPIIDRFLDDETIMREYQTHQRSWSELEFPYRYGLMKAQSFVPLARAICFSPDVLKISKEIQIPIILFSGAKDKVIPIEKTDQLAARLKVHHKVVNTGSEDHFQSDRWGKIQEETIEFFKEILT